MAGRPQSGRTVLAVHPALGLRKLRGRERSIFPAGFQMQPQKSKGFNRRKTPNSADNAKDSSRETINGNYTLYSQYREEPTSHRTSPFNKGGMEGDFDGRGQLRKTKSPLPTPRLPATLNPPLPLKLRWTSRLASLPPLLSLEALAQGDFKMGKFDFSRSRRMRSNRRIKPQFISSLNKG